MTIAILGSRSIPETSKELNVVSTFVLSHIKMENIECIISGGAEGADQLGYLFYRINRNKIPEYREFGPQWDSYSGHQAAYVRNKTIIQQCEMIFIFWNGEVSKGTKMDIDICENLHKMYYVYNYKEEMEKAHVNKRKPLN